MTPPPMTTRWRGTSRSSSAPVEERMRDSSNLKPGISMVEEPVATMTCLACTVRLSLPEATSRAPGPANVARPDIISTLLAFSRPATPEVSLSTTDCFHLTSLPMSTTGGAKGTPCSAPLAAGAPARRGPSEGLQQEELRVLEVREQRVGEHGAVVAVDDAVVEAEAQVHAPADADLAVLDDGDLLHLVDAHDGDLGVVQDGRRHDAAELAEAGDAERGAGELLDLGLAGLGARGEVVDLARDVEDALLVGVLDDGHDEAGVGGGRD